MTGIRTPGFAVLLFALSISQLAPALPAAAGDEPFTYPSNLGVTGLLETPTARVMKEDRYRIGASEVRPYRTYFGTIGLFKRMEVNGRVTEVDDVPGFENSPDYGDFKDKAIDIKLKLLPEGKFTPALSLAIFDPHGTRIFSSQAIVASKQIYPFDFSIGLGNGRFGKNSLASRGGEFGIELFTDPKAWWNDAQLFGGIQFAPTENFAIVAEYSPIRYHVQTGDPAQKKYFPDRVPSRINAGIRWKPTRWSEIDASYQRGNQFSVAASVSFDIGNPMIPIYDPPYREPSERMRDPVPGKIAAALSESGFSDIGVESDGLTLLVEAQNDKYFFHSRAFEVMLDVVAARIPDQVDYIRIVLKDNGIPLCEFVTTARGLLALRNGEISRDRFLGLSGFKDDADRARVKNTMNRRRLQYGVKPSLETFLNDPSGYFKYRIGLSGWLSWRMWTGGSGIIGIEGYPVNTVSTSVAPLSIPVRSDIAEYKKEDIALGRFMMEQVMKAPYPLYGRLSAGLLEVEYAGIDSEIAVPLLRGRILAGASGSFVRKREPGNPFQLKGSERYHTTFLNTRVNVPEYKVYLDVKAGRFLAGDKGARFTLAKSINGVVLSAWYALTDTSIFSDTSNRDYREKGISVDIPIRLFTGQDSRTSYRYALSPWTRDVAQDILHYRTLFDIINGATGFTLDNESRKMYTVR